MPSPTPTPRALRWATCCAALSAAGLGLDAERAARAQGVAPAVAPAASAAKDAPAAAASAASAADTGVLPVVRARAAAEPQGRDGVQATTVRIGKGAQDPRDVPQSLTVVTERLIDDRNLDTVRDALRNTAGISFLAAEGGEQDIRLRGFALQSTGDVFVDGMRDPAFYDRDTFFLDQLEVLRGSASLLFGRGSTGGAVNQVTKVPRLLTEHRFEVTLGNHEYLRAVGDFNLRLAPSTALRLGTMYTHAANDGAGTPLDKQGLAATLRSGIGERHEWSAALYLLDNDNGINYGLPYIRRRAGAPVEDTTLLPVSPTAYYGMASDRNHGQAETATLGHTWRPARGQQLVTKLRLGHYTRDQRASTIRLGGAALQPGGIGATLETIGPASVLTRATQLKIQSMDTLYAQSDWSSSFAAWGLRHEVQAGLDLAQERKHVRAALSAAQGGVDLVKPNTLVGSPDDGARINEDARRLREASAYESRGAGLYLQDLLELRPGWKLLLGLRYDRLVGDYDSFAIPANAAGPQSTTSYRMKVGELSKRAGLLYQPNERVSLHFAGATSFNTSGDAYSLSAANVDIPPEQAINLELGARIDSADGDFSVRTAVFRSTKLHERNTDPLVNLVTLSGRRHAAGFEIDLAGRPAPQWEVFASYMWLPVATIDEGSPGAEGQGTRPSLTPRHTGSLWTTYQLTQALRAGGGLNARSSQTPNRNPGFAVPGFVTADLMAEYQAVYGKLIFKLNVSNVTDKRYADQLYTAHYVPGAGRLVQLSGTYKF
ncbi:MAG: TonB-dependent siderophore receptor [Rubrivivax sp.]